MKSRGSGAQRGIAQKMKIHFLGNFFGVVPIMIGGNVWGTYVI